ncbi:uncharacterized protein LOC136079961 [Hydra vulgaris]|uniref:Uncharacterized protein LOC136079961 n=1 Tax=Hydra vulgaris TaxID=6087 RepID=A0ABM4BU44_HYDVU
MQNLGVALPKRTFAPLLQTAIAKTQENPTLIPNGFKSCGLCPFLLKNLDLTKVPLSVQENQIQRDLIESAETPVKAELLSPIDKAKNDLETDMTNGQLKSFRVHRNLMYWAGTIEQEALFYYWQKKMNKIEGVDPTTREKNMVLETPLEEILVSNENLTRPESTIEYNETTEAPVQGPLQANDNVFESIFVSPEEFQSKKVPKQATKVSSVIMSDEYIASLEEKKRAKEELER